MTLILALESSCDETACAIIKDGKDILSNIVSSQINVHTQYGESFQKLLVVFMLKIFQQ